MSKKPQRNEPIVEEKAVNPPTFPQFRRQFKTPDCPNCRSDNTRCFSQATTDGVLVVKYCKCDACLWTWSVQFRKPQMIENR